MTEKLILPSYADAEHILNHADLPVSPAECHGLLTGMLCIARSSAFAIERICELLPEDAHTSLAFTELQQFLMNLATLIIQQLADPELGFRLLLPDDSASIKTRSEDLGLWAAAFISGLGEAGILISSKNDSVLPEILNDLTAIAQINADDIGDTEEEEKSLAELEEYLRIAALTIYTETALNNPTATPIKQSIH
jgi:uncharacterized protein YgfB (UPF0149 family)